MKKKMLIPVVICLVLLIIFIVLVLVKTDKKEITTITLDINPSIEIKLEKDEVKEVRALNSDGERVIDSVQDDMNLEDTLKEIMNKVIELDYIFDDHAVVLVYVDGKQDMEELERYLNGPLSESGKSLEMIVIDKITKEDEKFAKKHNISLAKAHYINELAKERDVKPEDYVNKSISEIKETKDTGRTCGEGYALRGDFCFKEIAREDAKTGKVCPRGYTEYKGKCYEEVGIEETENYVCAEDRVLREDKCIRTETREAQPKSFTCTSGELTKKSDNSYVCADTSKATHPMSPCELHDGTETTMSGGKCYWHRAPVIAAGCPGKIQVKGECWDDASSVLICEGYRDGKRYSSRSEYCEHSIKYIDPTVTEYKCPSDFKLDGNKCYKDEIEPAEHERTCKSGYTLVNHDRCINKDATANKEAGFICDMPNSRLKDKACIIYDVIEAKH